MASEQEKAAQDDESWIGGEEDGYPTSEHDRGVSKNFHIVHHMVVLVKTQKK